MKMMRRKPSEIMIGDKTLEQVLEDHRCYLKEGGNTFTG